jgi:tRNA threonylcarbamoyl adenosine modification protein (Sua5/YciO/YrdC/YwlC family)
MKRSTTYVYAPGEPTSLLIPERPEDYAWPAALLKAGQLVAFPTETVYGLGAIATDPAAVAKIYQAKGRPSDNPLIVHVAKVEDISRLVREITPLAACLIHAFMPGPITLVMKKSARIPDLVSAGLPTVGIRMPSHKVALSLLSSVGEGVAAPSANLSGSPSPTKAEHVMADLNGRIPLILDGGACDVGLESTVVDVTGQNPIILRPGAITRQMIENACRVGGLQIVATTETKSATSAAGSIPKAPGMKYRHYAPNAPVSIVMASDLISRKEELLPACRAALHTQKKNVGVFCANSESQFLASSLSQDELSRVQVYVYGEALSIDQAARNLFDGLRSLDMTNVGLILAVGFSGDGIERAYMNRLRKASTAAKVSETDGQVGDEEKRVLFVCTGNTCRSPMAEAAFRSLVSARGPYVSVTESNRFVRISTASAGIFANEGSPAADHAVSISERLFGVDLSGHRSKKTTKEIMEAQDLIFAMTNEHASLLRRFFPGVEERIFSFSEYFSTKGIQIKNGRIKTEVPDPYGDSSLVYRETAEQLHQLLSKAWSSIMQDLGINDLSKK